MDLQTQIHNEKVKLRSGLLNSVASGCLSAGSVTPFGLLVFGTAPSHRHLWFWAVGIAMLFAVGIWFHARALKTMEGLTE